MIEFLPCGFLLERNSGVPSKLREANYGRAAACPRLTIFSVDQLQYASSSGHGHLPGLPFLFAAEWVIHPSPAAVAAALQLQLHLDHSYRSKI